MKSEVEIKQRLRSIQVSKAVAKKKGNEIAYIVGCKLEKLFKWVLDKEEIKIKDKRIKSGDYKK